MRPAEDQPPCPATLFLADTEAAETCVTTASAMPATALPILVSDRYALSGRGILVWSWPPPWDDESPALSLREPDACGWAGLRLRMRRQETRYSY